MEERVSPVKLTDHNTDITYTLDFSRDSIRFAEQREFTLEKAFAHPVSGMRELFYISFRMHHKNVALEKIDKFIERWGGGVPEALVGRLVQLFQQAQSANSIVSDEDAEKNSGLTLEL